MPIRSVSGKQDYRAVTSARVRFTGGRQDHGMSRNDRRREVHARDVIARPAAARAPRRHGNGYVPSSRNQAFPNSLNCAVVEAVVLWLVTAIPRYTVCARPTIVVDATFVHVEPSVLR
jgi:hypothetical protein